MADAALPRCARGDRCDLVSPAPRRGRTRRHSSATRSCLLSGEPDAARALDEDIRDPRFFFYYFRRPIRQSMSRSPIRSDRGHRATTSIPAISPCRHPSRRAAGDRGGAGRARRQDRRQHPPRHHERAVADRGVRESRDRSRVRRGAARHGSTRSSSSIHAETSRLETSRSTWTCNASRRTASSSPTGRLGPRREGPGSPEATRSWPASLRAWRMGRSATSTSSMRVTSESARLSTSCCAPELTKASLSKRRTSWRPAHGSAPMPCRT